MIGVVGLGNILMGDDGLGIEAVNKLKKDYIFDPPIEIIDGGVGSFSLPLHKFKKVIIIDAIKDNFKRPGDFISYTKNDILSGSIKNKLSLHDISLEEILILLDLRGELPEEIFLFGLIPYYVNLFDMGLSDIIKKRLPILIKNVIEKLHIWGVIVEEKISK